MDAIREYLRKIAGYLIVSVLIQNLVTKKEYEPYIRLFLNLLLVLLFVSPILSISADHLSQTWLEAAASWSEGTYLEADLKKLNEKQTTLELSAQKKILEEELGSLLESKSYRLKDLSLFENMDGSIAGIEVTVRKNAQADEYQGLSYGEEIEPAQMLKDYLSGLLSPDCEIFVRLDE